MVKLVLFICVMSATLCKKSKRSDIEELIVGGKPIGIEEVPYQAGFYYRGYYFCAGCVVSETNVVTAAHCLVYLPDNPEGVHVRVGSSKMGSGGQAIKVEKVAIHPKFSGATVDYDVAVVELASPLKYNSAVQPIKLVDSEPEEGEEVKVSGWGFIREIGPPSRKLRSIQVIVVNRKTCAQNYRDRIVVTNRMICASAENKDACYGDSGGPLVWRNRLTGIVSTGQGCARKHFPGIYTSVANSEVKNFIRKELSRNAKKKTATDSFHLSRDLTLTAS